MDGEGLKIYAFTEIPSAGYPGEEVGSSVPSRINPGPEGQPNQFEAQYFYRDSQKADNNSSSRVDVTIRQEYTYNKLKNNRYSIKVKGYLTKIERGKLQTSNGAILPNPGRTIQVWGVNKQNVFGPRNTYPNQAEVIFSGNAYLGEISYELGPGGETALADLACVYRSYTTGYWTGDPNRFDNPASEYLDQMHMGLRFVNDLPKECDPPEMTRVTQSDDICENTVDVCMRFSPSSCEGMGLVVQYHFKGESWDTAVMKGQETQVNASDESSTTVCFYGLPPTNHTKNPTVFYWRAKYVPVTADMPETEWVEGQFNLMFILAPHETVPDIDENECSRLQRGDLIGKYEEETCYNDYSCADMTVRNPDREADVEECKKVNKV